MAHILARAASHVQNFFYDGRGAGLCKEGGGCPTGVRGCRAAGPGPRVHVQREPSRSDMEYPARASAPLAGRGHLSFRTD
jgi:hypothetical protein